MKLTFDDTDALIRYVHHTLKDWKAFEWTTQGFGFVRTYIDGTDYRLNVWHSGLRITNVSDIHTHPWDFASKVVCGTLRNQRYVVRNATVKEPYTHMGAALKPGPDGGLYEDTKALFVLRPLEEENYRTGQSYTQEYHEIHRTIPGDGTVTLNIRVRPESIPDQALVFWPADENWVNARPRLATLNEIQFAVNKAMEVWDNGDL